ncbi:hypothetical protein RKE29_00435, partial [Streptomyces sp. B1866]|nr:hypothetical protein [Streptomyces sp. B1866]
PAPAGARPRPARPVGRRPRDIAAWRAPAMAAGALALAVVSAVLAILATVDAIDAASKVCGKKENCSPTLSGLVGDTSMRQYVLAGLLTAAAGLVLAALARREVRSAPKRYDARTAGTASLLARFARPLAWTGLVLAAVVLVAYEIARQFV